MDEGNHCSRIQQRRVEPGTSIYSVVISFAARIWAGETLEFEYEITRDDYAAGQWLYVKSAMGRRMIICLLPWYVLGILAITTSWADRFASESSHLLFLCGLFFLFMAVYSSFPRSRSKCAYRKTGLDGKRFRATINEDGSFQVVGDVRSWTVANSGIERCAENERAFIFVSAGTIFIFSKRFLDHEQQLRLHELVTVTSTLR